MATFSVGQIVQIRCEVQPGPFPTEMLVTFPAMDGPISGFVQRDKIKRLHGEEGYLDAVVKEVSSDAVSVVIEGSFFTTNGLAHFNRVWADSHVRVMHA